MYLYLAGPITGLTLAEATDWRENELMLNSLAKHGYICLSPLRTKAHLERFANSPLPARYSDDEEAMEVLTDIEDIKASVAVLANLYHADRVSIGTMWEMGYAYALDKPVITVLEPQGVHDHLFVHRCSHRVVPSMFEAVAELAILAGQLREPAYA